MNKCVCVLSISCMPLIFSGPLWWQGNGVVLGIGASRAYASIKRKWPYLTFLRWMSNFCTLTTPRTLFASLVETKGKKKQNKKNPWWPRYTKLKLCFDLFDATLVNIAILFALMKKKETHFLNGCFEKIFKVCVAFE